MAGALFKSALVLALGLSVGCSGSETTQCTCCNSEVKTIEVCTDCTYVQAPCAAACSAETEACAEADAGVADAGDAG